MTHAEIDDEILKELAEIKDERHHISYETTIRELIALYKMVFKKPIICPKCGFETSITSLKAHDLASLMFPQPDPSKKA